MKSIERTKFNVLVLGDTNIGKSSLINSLFGLYYESFISQSYNVLDETMIDGKKYKFKIYKTHGQERFRSIYFSLIKIADGIIIVFSIDNRNSFELIDLYLKEIKNRTGKNFLPIYIAASRIDRYERVVTNEEAINFCKNRNLKYFETSAKTGFGVKELFHSLYHEIYYSYKKLEKMIDFSGEQKNSEKNLQQNKNNEYYDINKNYMSLLLKFYKY